MVLWGLGVIHMVLLLREHGAASLNVLLGMQPLSSHVQLQHHPELLGVHHCLAIIESPLPPHGITGLVESLQPVVLAGCAVSLGFSFLLGEVVVFG